ncbi:MAG: hypothetical protein AAGH41_02790 [Pseudomonadota bacterium]
MAELDRLTPNQRQSRNRGPYKVRPIGDAAHREISKMVELDQDRSNRILDTLDNWTICLSEYEERIQELLE